MFRGESWIRHAGVALLLLASLGAGSIALPHARRFGCRVQSDPGRARRKRPPRRARPCNVAGRVRSLLPVSFPSFVLPGVRQIRTAPPRTARRTAALSPRSIARISPRGRSFPAARLPSRHLSRSRPADWRRHRYGGQKPGATYVPIHREGDSNESALFLDAGSRIGRRRRSRQQTAVLEGRLVNSLNGDPLAGATVVIDELKQRSRVRRRRRVPLRQPRARHVPPLGSRAGLFVAAHGSHRARRRRRACRASHRFRSPLPGGGIGQRRSAQPVRRVPADDGAVGTGTDQTAGKLAGRDAREPARHRLAQLRLRALAAGHPRAGRRSRADSAGWPAHRRFVEPVGRPRRQRQSGGRRNASKWFAGRPRLLYGANAIGGLVNVITNEIPTRPVQGASGEVDVRRRDCRGGRRWRPGTCSLATASSP